MPYITKSEYDAYIAMKVEGKFIRHICYVESKLGMVRRFKVQSYPELFIDMRCTQQGGMFTGSHAFEPI